jgi:hypothetical protein
MSRVGVIFTHLEAISAMAGVPARMPDVAHHSSPSSVDVDSTSMFEDTAWWHKLSPNEKKWRRWTLRKLVGRGWSAIGELLKAAKKSCIGN